MRYLIPLMLLALPVFAQTTPAPEPAPPVDVISGAPSYDLDALLEDNRCRDGLVVLLFSLTEPASVTQFLMPRRTEGAIPMERIRTPEAQSQRGPVDDPVKVRRDCEEQSRPKGGVITAI